ncbi:hypothetical protein LUPINE_22 [Microbacterium phage Lupine]|nr:hypothetical protein LUPINE_22 [Microbacterium phage Lupine]
MRKTDIDETISRHDVKVGDTIRISREATVTNIRETTLGTHKRAIIATVTSGDGINANTETLALTDKETVTLLERDQSLDFGGGALIVTWGVVDDAQSDLKETYFAMRLQDEANWVASDGDEYRNDEALEEAILDGEFGEYVDGTFKVIEPKPKPKFASGGFVGGDSILGRMSAAAQAPYLGFGRSILPQNIGARITDVVA